MENYRAARKYLRSSQHDGLLQSHESGMRLEDGGYMSFGNGTSSLTHPLSSSVVHNKHKHSATSGGCSDVSCLNGSSSSFEEEESGDLAGLRILFGGWINTLLLLLPFAYYSSFFGFSGGTQFTLCMISLIPLASLIGNVTEELALHTGELIGGLLNATFGNAVEMIITVQALRIGKTSLVKSSLLGSVLSNVLLVLGTSFVAAGIYYKESSFNAQGASSNTSLLLLSCLGLALPSIFKYQPSVSDFDVLKVSRISAIFILITYLLFVYFQLVSHASLFQNQVEEALAEDHLNNSMLSSSAHQQVNQLQVVSDKRASNKTPLLSETSNVQVDEDDDDEEETPIISRNCALILLFLVTVVTSLVSDKLVDSIEVFTEAFSISETFIGVILLPLAGNAVEHWTAVSVAIKNKLDLSIGVAAGSSTQVALFGFPFAILCGWYLDQPMSLDLTLVEIAILFISVIIVISVVQDGKSNWLEGVMLIVAYLLTATLLWYTPNI